MAEQYRFGRERAFVGSAGGGGVGWRGPGRVPVVGCLQDPGAEVAGIRASSGRVVKTGIHTAAAVSILCCNTV